MVVTGFIIVRRIGMTKPPVKLGVGKKLGYRTKCVGFIGDGASKLLAPSLF